MIKKSPKAKFQPHEHLQHWVTKTTYAQRLQWLEEANQLVEALRRKKGWPNLSWKS